MTLQAPEFYAHTRDEWRAWLIEHHMTADKLWLVYDKKSAGGVLSYDDIVEEALCFGWIDSVGGKVDEVRTKLYLTKRKPKSVWSKLNKQRLERLIPAGSMYPAGLAAVAIAKSNGAWEAIDALENMIVPPDLKSALQKNPVAYKHFLAFPRGSQKIILQWVASAKRPETRAARIAETVRLAEQNIRAQHYRKASAN